MPTSQTELLQGLGTCLDRLREQEKALFDFMHFENFHAAREINDYLRSSDRAFRVGIELNPDGTVSLSKLVRIGRDNHRWWRQGKEFPELTISGTLIGVYRVENRGGVSWTYELVLKDVRGYPDKHLRFYVPLDAIRRFTRAMAGKKIGNSGRDEFGKFNQTDRPQMMRVFI